MNWTELTSCPAYDISAWGKEDERGAEVQNGRREGFS